VTSAAPEPSFAPLVLGLLGAALWRRRLLTPRSESPSAG
jgi:hypothetical protein